MRLKIDHVTIAAPRLEPLQQAFTEAGMAPDYGGPHSNNVTHMALVGFDDGSYIELISTLAPDAASPWWHAHIAGDAGPCAWAVEVDDVAAEAARVRALGIPVKGPHHYARGRPDGTRIEWDLAILGEQGMGAMLPFIIKDRTPRSHRVSPSASVAATELTGVAVVVLAVESLEPAIARFRRVYQLPSPKIDAHPTLGAELAAFAQIPVVLAAPLGSGALSERVKLFGPSPCAFLIGTQDLRRSRQRFPLSPAERCFGRELSWLRTPLLQRYRLGLISV